MAPQHICKTPRLVEVYPTLEEFFRETIHVRNADAFTLVEEMQEIQASDSIKYISELFVALSYHMRIDPDISKSEEIAYLCTLNIFPVSESNSEGEYGSLITADLGEVWFIADRPHLRQSFSGNISLLAFDLDTLARMESLLNAVYPLWYRLLSKVARGISNTQGSIKFLESYTRNLQAKARFISR
jgi:hypothetical protein